MSYDIQKLSKEARTDMAELYNKSPSTIKSLCDWPGEVGRLANICLACGEHYSH